MMAESGHPTRSGFGNSRDRPRANRSKMRFSSSMEFTRSIRTRLSLKLLPQGTAKFTAHHMPGASTRSNTHGP